ncbi:MAG: GNAT family N-acetyltransferase [Rhizobacter sp.]
MSTTPFVPAVRTFRPARPDEAERLCRAEQITVAAEEGLLVSHADELEHHAFRERIEQAVAGRGRYQVAEVHGEVVAHGSLWPMAPRAVSHVLRLDLCVHPGYRQRGHGRALLDDLLGWARSVSGAHKVELLVRADNTAAVALYHSAVSPRKAG